MRRNKLSIKQVWLMSIAALTVISAVKAPVAEAMVFDRGVIGKLQDQRHILLLQEQKLQKDYDELSRDINDLCKQDEDPRLIDELNRKREGKFRDLQSVQGDIKQVERKLI